MLQEHKDKHFNDHRFKVETPLNKKTNKQKKKVYFSGNKPKHLFAFLM